MINDLSPTLRFPKFFRTCRTGMKNDKGTLDVFAPQDFVGLRLRFRGQIQMQIDLRGSQFPSAPETQDDDRRCDCGGRTNQ